MAGQRKRVMPQYTGEDVFVNTAAAMAKELMQQQQNYGVTLGSSTGTQYSNAAQILSKT